MLIKTKKIVKCVFSFDVTKLKDFFKKQAMKIHVLQQCNV